MGDDEETEREKEVIEKGGGKKREIPKESVHGAEKYRQIAYMHTYMRAHDVAFNNR